MMPRKAINVLRLQSATIAEMMAHLTSTQEAKVTCHGAVRK